MKYKIKKKIIYIKVSTFTLTHKKRKFDAVQVNFEKKSVTLIAILRLRSRYPYSGHLAKVRGKMYNCRCFRSVVLRKLRITIFNGTESFTHFVVWVVYFMIFFVSWIFPHFIRKKMHGPKVWHTKLSNTLWSVFLFLSF